jgi:hypothetical protein
MKKDKFTEVEKELKNLSIKCERQEWHQSGYPDNPEGRFVTHFLISLGEICLTLGADGLWRWDDLKNMRLRKK